MASRRRFEALQFDFSDVEEAVAAVPAESGAVMTSGRQAGAAEDPAAAGPLSTDGGEQGDGTQSGDLIEMVARVARVQAMSRSSLPQETRVPGASSDEALSVTEFYNRVHYAFRNEFPGELWVTGEIRKVTTSKGNRYLELADRHAPPDRVAAAIDVSCWSKNWPRIAAQLQSVGIELTEGLVVRIRGRVGVWEGGARIRFSMTDLDVEALVGGIAAARRRLITSLESEGLLAANKRLGVPAVPLRIGVVTSAGGEAYRDFTGPLANSGFAFDVRLEASLVQGIDAPPQIVRAIRRLHAFEPDLIVVVRGGGAKGDLAAFDAENVARAIATSRFPVWTGVGHTGDQSVADEVAQRACITPTACGEAVVAAVRSYVEATEARAVQLAAKGRTALDLAVARVDDAKARLGRSARQELDQASSNLVLARARARNGAVIITERHQAAVGSRAARIAAAARHGMATATDRLAGRQAMLDAFDLRRQLARGWSLTRGPDGRLLRSVEEVGAGSEIMTLLADGSLTSTVLRSSGDLPIARVPAAAFAEPLAEAQPGDDAEASA